MEDVGQVGQATETIMGREKKQKTYIYSASYSAKKISQPPFAKVPLSRHEHVSTIYALDRITNTKRMHPRCCRATCLSHLPPSLQLCGGLAPLHRHRERHEHAPLQRTIHGAPQPEGADQRLQRVSGALDRLLRLPVHGTSKHTYDGVHLSADGAYGNTRL